MRKEHWKQFIRLFCSSQESVCVCVWATKVCSIRQRCMHGATSATRWRGDERIFVPLLSYMYTVYIVYSHRLFDKRTGVEIVVVWQKYSLVPCATHAHSSSEKFMRTIWVRRSVFTIHIHTRKCGATHFVPSKQWAIKINCAEIYFIPLCCFGRFENIYIFGKIEKFIFERRNEEYGYGCGCGDSHRDAVLSNKIVPEVLCNMCMVSQIYPPFFDFRYCTKSTEWTEHTLELDMRSVWTKYLRPRTHTLTFSLTYA